MRTNGTFGSLAHKIEFKIYTQLKFQLIQSRMISGKTISSEIRLSTNTNTNYYYLDLILSMITQNFLNYFIKISCI